MQPVRLVSWPGVTRQPNAFERFDDGCPDQGPSLTSLAFAARLEASEPWVHTKGP